MLVKIRQKIQLSLLLPCILSSCIVSVALANHLSKIWYHPLPIQTIIILLPTIVFSIVIYWTISQIRALYADRVIRKSVIINVLAILLLAIGVYWRLMGNEFLVPTPPSMHTLEIVTGTANNSESQGTEVDLIQIVIGGESKPLSIFESSNNWVEEAKYGYPTVLSTNQKASLSYKFISDPYQEVRLIFYSYPSGGSVEVRFDNQVDVIDLYAADEGELPVIFDAENPGWKFALNLVDIFSLCVIFLLLEILGWNTLLFLKNNIHLSKFFYSTNFFILLIILLAVSLAVILLLWFPEDHLLIGLCYLSLVYSISVFILIILKIFFISEKIENDASTEKPISLNELLKAIVVWVNTQSQELIQIRTLFIICCVVVVLAFLIARISWFIDFPLPLIFYDTGTYFDPLKQMVTGQWPTFDLRTPGYPLFLAVAFLISPKLMFVIVLQNLLTLCSVIFFLWVVYRTYGQLVIGTALVMIAHVTQPLLSAHDFFLITESLFTSCLLFSIGFLFLAIHTKKSRNFFLFSAIGGYAILVRPTGIFLCVCLLLTLLYLVVNRNSIKNILCLLLPMPMMIIMLMTYNFITQGEFEISNVTGQTFYAITSTYWEPDEAFPDEVNDGIIKFRSEISETDQQILNTSWDPMELMPLFIDSAVNSLYFNEDSLVRPKSSYHLSLSERLNLAEQVEFKAITSHPEMYLKFFWTNLYVFLDDTSSWHFNYYANIPWVARQMYVTGTATDKFRGREFSEIPEIPNLQITGEGENMDFVVMPTMLSSMHLSFTNSLEDFFDFNLWHFANLTVILMSLFIVLRSKFRHQGAYLLLTLSSIHLLAGAVMALSTAMTNRYPAPTRFIEVLAVVLIPLLWIPGDRESTIVIRNKLSKRKKTE